MLLIVFERPEKQGLDSSPICWSGWSVGSHESCSAMVVMEWCVVIRVGVVVMIQDLVYALSFCYEDENFTLLNEELACTHHIL